MQEQTNQNNMSLADQQQVASPTTGQEPLPQKHGSLGKFLMLFLLGCALFALFMTLAGKSPYNLTVNPKADVMAPKNTPPVQEESTQSVEQTIQMDNSKDESEVTKEVMDEIDVLGTSDENTDYDSTQLNELKE